MKGISFTLPHSGLVRAGMGLPQLTQARLVMDLEKYRHYSVEDFVLDARFRKAVLQHARIPSSFILALEQQFPQQEPAIRQARQVVRALGDHYAGFRLSEEEKARLKEDIFGPARELPKANPPIRRLRKTTRTLAGVAASFLLLALAAYGLGWWPPSDTFITRSTSVGEHLELDLPDGSRVTLNQGSSLRFAETWDKKASREVWLQGEAFFAVAKQAGPGAKFTVHTRALDVDVLGTQFNINDSPDSIQVSLEEGVIRLRLLAGTEPGKEPEAVILQKGDLAKYVKGQGLQRSSSPQPELYSNWRDSHISLKGVTLHEVEKTIERLYGVDLICRQASLYERRVDFPVANNDLEEVMRTLESLFNVDVSYADDQIILHQHQ